MNLSIRTRLIAASAAALLCVPASSWAGFSAGSWSAHGYIPATSSVSSNVGIWSAKVDDDEDDFLSRSVHELHPSTPVRPRESFQSEHKPGSWSRDYAQGTSTPRFLRGDSDVAIWNLISLVCAQREDRFLDELKVALHDLWKYENTSTPPVSPVPLPGSAWMMLMGLLGLAGARITGVSGGRQAGNAGDASDAVEAPHRLGQLEHA